MHPRWIEEVLRQLESGRRIMVASDDDDLKMGTFAEHPAQESVEALLSRYRRIDRIVHVTGDDQRVCSQLDQSAGQPVEERGVLDAAVKPVQVVAKMPVRGMD
jgi:hypothetical protein